MSDSRQPCCSGQEFHMLTKNRNDILCMLLTGAGIADLKTIDQGYTSADRLETALHKVLVMGGFVSQYKMDRALAAETMIKQSKISTDLAIKALRLATTQQLTFEEAVSRLDDGHKKTQLLPSVTNEITDLMVNAGLVTKEKIGAAIKVSLETGMQVSRVLVFQKDVTSLIMRSVLNCCLFIQDEKLTQDAALRALDVVKRTGVSVEQALFELGLYYEEPGQPPKIGELFEMAGFVSDSDMLECLEIHVLRGRQLGQIFLEQGLVNHQTLEDAIVLQGMIGPNSIKAYHAAIALKQANAKQISVYQALAEIDPPAMPAVAPLKFDELIVNAGLMDVETMKSLIGEEELTAVQIAKRLLAAEYLGDRNCFAALRCFSLNKEGLVSNVGIAQVLKRCLISHVSLDESLRSHGYYVPTRFQWIWR